MTTKKKEQTQLNLIMEYFEKHPYKDIHHPEVVDWATKEWKKRKGSVFRDPDRGIRSLHERGYLVKVNKGVYRYDPKNVENRVLEDFTAQQRKEILKRDNYKYIVCGHGEKEGFELHIDHIKAKKLGGRATKENGQTLCSQHNFLKGTAHQTEVGKKMFIRLYELLKGKNRVLEDFCENIFKVYEKHNIDGHIKWEK